jgi:hypothetical protein
MPKFGFYEMMKSNLQFELGMSAENAVVQVTASLPTPQAIPTSTPFF